MTDEPVTYSSLMPYYILLFAVLLIWSFAGVEASSYLMVSLYSNPLIWVAYSISIVISISPILWLIARTMKRQISLNPNVSWEFHAQELRYDEYAAMMTDYRSGYSHLIARSDQRLLIASIVVLIVAVIVPLALAAISVSLLFILPFTYGALQLVYGILLTTYFYRSISNEASAHFHYENPDRLKEACMLLEDTPGFAMVGVVFLIGEAGGYYAFRSPAAIGRIAGIEAVAKVEVTVGNISPPMTAFGTVSSPVEGEASKRMMELELGNELKQLEGIVRWCITTYVEENGSNEILDELIEELAIDLESGEDSPPSID
ncbi:MAG: hypothetical protein ACFFER_04175 [Candidatus Thorarchaeota archaeon]